MNHVLHSAAIVQISRDTEGSAYYRRKLAESKTPMEALRCLKRRLSDAVYRQLIADAHTGQPDDTEGDQIRAFAAAQALTRLSSTDEVEASARQEDAARHAWVGLPPVTVTALLKVGIRRDATANRDSWVLRDALLDASP